MDQDFGYEDLVDKKVRVKKEPGKRKPLLRIVLIILTVLLLAVLGYTIWSRPELFSFLPKFNSAGAPPSPVETTPFPAAVTETIEATLAGDLEPTATSQPTEEPPTPLTPQAILPLPEYGYLVQTRSDGGDREEQAVKLATEMAIHEPFLWEYLEFDSGTQTKDVESYYINLVNKEMGFLMNFNDKYPNSGLAIFKWRRDTQRVTIQFFEERPDRAPSAFVFYEGW